MDYPIQVIFLIVAVLLIASIVASKLANRFGVPALLLFILIGISIGSEGFGGIEFDNPQLTQSVGVLALVFILFSGGMDTRWQSVKMALGEGLLLSTVGVLITALSVGWLAQAFLGFTWPTGILLGATMASTDAAAVFSVLRGKSVGLKGKLRPVLELESGSNDPMAVFLTLGMIQLITTPATQLGDLLVLFVVQMSLGLVIGILSGYLMRAAINQLRLEYDGLYPVLTISFVLLCYGLTTLMGGNGFLAIYLCGLVLGRSDFIHKNSLLQFHDGIAWLMQIIMFIILGLQVFPSRLLDVALVGFFVAAFMIVIARPLSVFIALAPVRMSLQEKVFISWVGLRGAAPIILATFSQLAAIEMPVPIFDLVFFVVLVSVLLQGTTIVPVARWLNLYQPDQPTSSFFNRMLEGEQFKSYLIELEVSEHSNLVGQRLLQLGLPQGALVVLINRASKIIIPQGRTTLQAHDYLLILSPPEYHAILRQRFAADAMVTELAPPDDATSD
ncbi:potassium/proton antiporter [Phototrophicus methaneseepsis]|uniref:Potassium/proton antiporter n=1 Tax=Phototrophicus methaneseepsis TaxID=2710758 RepID=A0A7S8ECH4_9CHLR|nr:potassium/proton antiporter [Phototrophicus methaneseepsis]QPC84203.1 potassium/proton antiporter [Phototrophicus methaneseepsis]